MKWSHNLLRCATLLHPHPFGADPKVSSAKPDIPGGNRLLAIEKEFLEVPQN